MKWKILILGIMALAALCVFPVGAAELPDRSTNEIITPWYDYVNGLRAIDPVYGSVTQGALQSFDYDIGSGKRTLEVALSWDNSQNSLKLYIIRPDGHRYGPYYDNFDGQINGAISLVIRNNPLAPGTWNAEIWGDSVSGTQSFTLTLNAI